MVFALPGVPAEMMPMWAESVAPAITAARGEARVIRHRRIKCFGVGESQLEAMLPDLIRRGREPSVGITVSDATITLRITAAGTDDAACLAAMAPVQEIIQELLGTIAYGEEEDELEDAVVRMLAERNQTVAVAEWATDGLLSEWLARASRGLSVFAGGLVLNSERKSVGILQSAGHAWHLPHQSDAATAAAEAVRRSAKADFGIGVAAFPSEPDEPNARVYVSIATPERTRRLRFGCAAHPAIRQARTAKQALNALRLILLGRDAGDA
jgi:nicotinamide-nucleotide amidase